MFKTSPLSFCVDRKTLARLSKRIRSKKNLNRDVLQTIVRLFAEARDAFPDERVFDRALRLGLGILTGKQRRTITAMMVATGSTDADWTGFYRVFSRDLWEVSGLFGVVKKRLLDRLPPMLPAVAAIDDTKLRKSGKNTPGVSYQRDSMSPPFHTNFIRAQRFVQMSLSVPFSFDQPSASRSIPIDFRHAPPPPKPKPSASEQDLAQYRASQREQNLSRQGLRMIEDFRRYLDQADSPARSLIVTVDGSYVNKTVLKNLPERTVLIGRIRKDAELWQHPHAQPERGRKRQYGDRAPTPEQIRTDPDTPWQSVGVFASGRLHQCEVKSAGPFLWKKAGPDMPLRIIVIRPLSYRLTKTGRLLYRQPAFLVCTDPDMSLEQTVQAYFSRWDIEVNHRDEKQLIGVGQAQVRSPKAVDRAPAFAVAMYSLLLLANGLCHGFDAKDPASPQPKWRKGSSSPRVRITTGEMLEDLHLSAASTSLSRDLPNFTHFASRVARHLKLPKSQVTTPDAIAYAFS